MPWWGWIIIVAVIVAIAIGSFVSLQARRRRGGVIVGGTTVHPDGTTRRGGTP